MSVAIQYYEKGEDLEAMDHFMQILVRGNPQERPMANQYLNLISERMALGGKFDKKPPPAVTVVEEREAGPAEIEEVGGGERETPPSSVSKDTVVIESIEPRKTPPSRESQQRRKTQLTKKDRALMKQEIESKLKNRVRVLLSKLRRFEDIRVLMANSSRPRAVGIPTELLFSQGTQFKKDSIMILDALTHLVFSLGATQVVILPENSILDDSKIIDLRRTMGVSSHLIKEGIAPARIRVNLLSSQVNIPRGINDFRGILLLFVYNQPLTLTADGAVGTESGPPISIGVSPGELDPDKEEGSIIEFSVMEPPVGLRSWRFQLLGSDGSSDKMIPLQEVKGAGPVFHQIFWNGRAKYFGEKLAGGRYECLLTATDQQGRTRKRYAWIKVQGPEAPRPEVKTAKAEKQADETEENREAPPAELPPDEDAAAGRPKAVTVDPRQEGKAKERRLKRRSDRRARRRAAQDKKGLKAKTIETAKKPAEKETSSPPRAGAVNYQVLFVKNTASLTPDGENILSRVSDTMHYYPLDNINLVGYAYTGERNSQSLASQRADAVSRLLIERYGMKRDRIQVQTKILESESHKVEIYIVSGGS
ncbi:MAG: OmpA family protein [Elusimicrobiota bacterium]